MTDMIKKHAEYICKVLYEKKADDVVMIDIQDKSVIADYMIICSGRSNTLVKTLCDEVDEKMAIEGFALRRKEGYSEAHWIVMDFGDILVHIFHPDERKYYDMERLWEDSKNTVRYVGE